MVIFSLSILTPNVHTGSCEGNREVVSAIFQPNHYPAPETPVIFRLFLVLSSDHNVYDITQGRAVFLTLLSFILSARCSTRRRAAFLRFSR